MLKARRKNQKWSEESEDIQQASLLANRNQTASARQLQTAYTQQARLLGNRNEIDASREQEQQDSKLGKMLIEHTTP